jgi:hypothetical protein
MSSFTPAAKASGRRVWVLDCLAQAMSSCGGLRDAARQESYTRAE